MAVNHVSYDVVMATRNRPDAVALSVPLILGQTLLPARVVIVDSSDDPSPIKNILERARAGTSVPIDYHRVDPSQASSALQRNIGVTVCTSDVIIFPDDDSLLYRDAAAEIMAVYAADSRGQVAAVCAKSASAPPPESDLQLHSFTAERTSRLRRALLGMRQRIKEMTGVTNPFLVLGTRLNHDRLPQGISPDAAALVPYMTGFRMSFRRKVIAAVKFDETLSRYAWFEDIDASWGAMRAGAVVVAQKAQIYHHRAAAQRADGHKMGLWAILNRGYVVMKHVYANPAAFPDVAVERRRLKLYCRARVAAYGLMARDSFGRDRLKGARQGLATLSRLSAAAPQDLRAVYKGLEGA
jgi:GT2 family glycosyltransferase